MVFHRALELLTHSQLIWNLSMTPATPMMSLQLQPNVFDMTLWRPALSEHHESFIAQHSLCLRHFPVLILVGELDLSF